MSAMNHAMPPATCMLARKLPVGTSADASKGAEAERTASTAPIHGNAESESGGDDDDHRGDLQTDG